MIYECFQVTGTHEAILEYPELFGITFHGDDVQGFDGTKFYCQSARYSKTIFWKACKKTRIRESDQLKTVLALNEQETEQHHSQPSHQKLKTMVKRCTDQKIRARNFEARDR